MIDLIFNPLQDNQYFLILPEFYSFFKVKLNFHIILINFMLSSTNLHFLQILWYFIFYHCKKCLFLLNFLDFSNFFNSNKNFLFDFCVTLFIINYQIKLI